MKKVLTTIGVAAMLAMNVTAGFFEDIGSTFSDFVKQNPTNSWDVWAYGLNNLTSSKPGSDVQDLSKGWGAGARVSYWIAPYAAVGFDGSYNDSSWTFANVALTFRGTINLGSMGTVSPYVSAGPGWNIRGADNGAVSSIVAVTSGGGVLHFNALKWFDLFGEYQHVTTDTPMDRVLFGVVKRF